MKPSETIVDSFGRVHDYLRISLTDRCNLRCTYCMPEEGIVLREKSEFMTSEEIVEIATTFVQMGVKKIRLTGGEPLIKKDIVNILTQLSQLPIELTLTTNAVLVDRYIETFKNVGIKSLNVSLDSLKSERMNAISRRDCFDRIMANIQLLLQSEIAVKLNVVLMKGVNDDEIIDFVEFTKHQKIDVRFIEFMPFSGNQWDRAKTVSLQEILNKVEVQCSSVQKLEELPNSTSRNYKIDKYEGTFGIISTVTNPFCDSCNRIRLTADGKLKNCLFSADESDLLTRLRNGEDIRSSIHSAIMSKKERLAGMDSFESELGKEIFSKNRSMISIGG
ncbi:MAG: GTP 3',8-cyclase MoaA [Flavobacteriales bacterium]|nr:GTP 3',8-cyclase MoaA [Flavobacteriales bacterium]